MTLKGLIAVISLCSLDETLKRINSYLKKDGIFIFSWSHPVHKYVTIENGHFLFENSYFNEDWYHTNIDNHEIMLSNRMLSTYIDSLSKNGFFIEEIIEKTDKEKSLKTNSEFSQKAIMLPTAFVIKSRKL